MNKLPIEKQEQVIRALVEGNSIRSTVRMTGVAKNTIQNLLLEVGAACRFYPGRKFKNLNCERIQCDEIWSFCYAKEKNVPKNLKNVEGFGDVWTFVGIDADTKLVVDWSMGRRNSETAWHFIHSLKLKLAHRIQLSTDGFKAYLWPIKHAFKDEVDYAMIQKIYGTDPSIPSGRYSPAHFVKAEKEVLIGNPDPKHISTSFVERQNLTMRMSMKRFSRLSNGFSKKLENMTAAVALHFMFYNFCRIHQTLRITPAMAAGLTDHVWEIEELIEQTKSVLKAGISN